MKLKNGKTCKVGKQHLYGEVAAGEFFETGMYVTTLRVNRGTLLA